ncbi:MAG: hypothetical protein NT071_05170 [Burkholderiales bacterium]|nr:hypothetical protein [Burkholderiales bacterium]
MRTPQAKIGEAVVTMLVALIQGEAQPQPLIDFGFEIVERDST